MQYIPPSHRHIKCVSIHLLIITLPSRTNVQVSIEMVHTKIEFGAHADRYPGIQTACTIVQCTVLYTQPVLPQVTSLYVHLNRARTTGVGTSRLL